jgi:MFS family permease
MNTLMLFGLVVCDCIVFTMGNGTLPLLPIYAKVLGASSATEGIYVALAYLCLAIGTVIGGRLSDRLQSRRSLLVLAGALLVPLQALMGLTRNVFQLIATTGLLWLAAGVTLATVGAIAGREADAAQRGKVFGFIGVSAGVGSLVGGLTIGPMVDAWGYPAMFFVLAGLTVLIPITALLTVKETQQDPASKLRTVPHPASFIGVAILLLLAAQLLGWVANGAGNMGRSISMNELNFSNTAITATAAIGGLLSLPLPLVLGWLSDRVGRKKVLITSYVAGTACLLILSVSQKLWQFWLVAALLSLLAVSMSVGPALVADIVSRERVGTAVSLFQSAQWLGTIVGFVYSGFAFQSLGIRSALAVASIAGVLAIVAALLIRDSSRSSAT